MHDLLWCQQSLLLCVKFPNHSLSHCEIKVMSYSLKHLLCHAALRGVRAQFVNSVSRQRPRAADSVTRTGYCRCFLAAFKTIPCSALSIRTVQGWKACRCKLRFYFWVRTEIYWLYRLFPVVSLCPHATKIPVFVYFRYSHGMGSATPLIQAKMDDPSWWRWRVGWAMAWSWCWTSSRMNTCLYGERLVSLPWGKTSAKTTRLCVYLCPFFNQLNTKVAGYFQCWSSKKSITGALIPEIEAWLQAIVHSFQTLLM